MLGAIYEFLPDPYLVVTLLLLVSVVLMFVAFGIASRLTKILKSLDEISKKLR